MGYTPPAPELYFHSNLVLFGAQGGCYQQHWTFPPVHCRLAVFRRCGCSLEFCPVRLSAVKQRLNAAFYISSSVQLCCCNFSVLT